VAYRLQPDGGGRLPAGSASGVARGGTRKLPTGGTSLCGLGQPGVCGQSVVAAASQLGHALSLEGAYIALAGCGANPASVSLPRSEVDLAYSALMHFLARRSGP
jgi:hypothetical protein